MLFKFGNLRRVLLECPIEGNATYILIGDWRQMAFETKADLRRRFENRYIKVVHKGGWLGQIWAALRD